MITLLLSTMLVAQPISGPQFLLGGDVSEIPEVKASGAVYRRNGKPIDPFDLMQQSGWNFVRFRLWNDPKGGFCDKTHTLEMAKRARAHGMKISLDFHYSDWWADPGKQNKPAAWKDLSFVDLNKALYDYTRDVVAAMVAQGTPPYMVQVGNEIIGGMLWPDGKVGAEDPLQWNRLATLLKSGFRAVHDASGDNKVLTMIHLDRGGDNKAAAWWFDHIDKEGVEYDTIGLSYYPFWHGHVPAMEANLNDLALRYKKDIYLVEVGYPWSVDVPGGRAVFADKTKLEPEFPATPEGQAAFLARVIDIVRKVPGGRGKGVLYWAPLWISAPNRQNPWNNMALFDYQGNAYRSVEVMGGRG